MIVSLVAVSIAVQVYWAMQTIAHGSHSLLNGVRRGFKAREFLDEQQAKGKCVTLEQALAHANALPADQLDPDDERWKEYVTLLNLRNWEKLGERVVTEQIYVHTKLMIVDDRYAIFGSANINDRSQLGDRDSEIATIVTDEVKVKLDGKNAVDCGKAIHTLRRALWETHFGLKSNNRKAASLAEVLDQPAAPATWQAIQKLAFDNAEAYENSFWYIPRSGAHPDVQTKLKTDTEDGPPPASIWPTWHYEDYRDHSKGGQLRYRMPFDPLFWREAERSDSLNGWNVTKDATRPLAPEDAPAARAATRTHTSH